MQPQQVNIDKPKLAFNKKLTSFFIRLFIVFSVWFVCYNLILKPPRVIDRPLTNYLTAAAVKCINIFYPSSAQVSWEESKVKRCADMFKEGKLVFQIYDVCNGIDLMFIYVGVLFLLPFPVKRKLWFSAAGIVVIALFNVVRICSLYFIYIYQRSAFDFSHHYLFTLLMYVVIFFGWLLFIRNARPNEKSN